ncbi:MAG TPA: ABC transporter substrate-binding protein [Verrucomicrobiae bacterium]|nr:ABC transporter substrate-binding protein [Verrucomicrobiae bacterium]
MNTLTLSRLITCAIFVAGLSQASLAEAGAPTEVLRGVFHDANVILTDPSTEQRPLERLVAIRALFSRVFDFRDAAERSLGRQWQARTAAEQQEFTRLFADFVQRGFVYWLASVAEVDGRAGGATVQFIGETVDRDTATVQTAILARGGRLIPLTHTLVYQNRRWVVRDVNIEGISLVANYRSQFDRVIRGSSYPQLVQLIRARIASEYPFPEPPGQGAAAVYTPAREIPFEMR